MVKRIAALLLALFGVDGCDAPDPFMPDRDEPGLYLILYPADDPLAFSEDPDGTLFGLLLTTGTPLATAYLTPDSVAVTREVDGAPLGFEVLDRSGEPAGFNYAGGLLSEGNLRLERDPSGVGTGAASIEPGDQYRLLVRGSDLEIRGSLQVPLRPVLRGSSGAESATVSWSPVPGAGAYEATFRGADGSFIERELGSDTLLIVPRPLVPGDRVTVYAYDQNLAAYLLDPGLGRAGLDTGFGFFGAVVTASIGF